MTIYYKKLAGYKYSLPRDVSCQTNIHKAATSKWCDLSKDGLLTIYKGWMWDGCSGPAIDTENNFRAGLVHDALYYLIRKGALDHSYREAADKELRRIFIEDGLKKETTFIGRMRVKARAWYYYQGVRNFAGWADDPKGEEQAVYIWER